MDQPTTEFHASTPEGSSFNDEIQGMSLSENTRLFFVLLKLPPTLAVELLHLPDSTDWNPPRIHVNVNHKPSLLCSRSSNSTFDSKGALINGLVLESVQLNDEIKGMSLLENARPFFVLLKLPPTLAVELLHFPDSTDWSPPGCHFNVNYKPSLLCSRSSNSTFDSNVVLINDLVLELVQLNNEIKGMSLPKNARPFFVPLKLPPTLAMKLLHFSDSTDWSPSGCHVDVNHKPYMLCYCSSNSTFDSNAALISGLVLELIQINDEINRMSSSENVRLFFVPLKLPPMLAMNLLHFSDSTDWSLSGCHVDVNHKPYMLRSRSSNSTFDSNAALINDLVLQSIQLNDEINGMSSLKNVRVFFVPLKQL